MAALYSKLALSELCSDRPDGILMPHFDNISWFFQCVGGIAELHACPDLQSFDVSLQKCDRFPTAAAVEREFTTTSTSTTVSPHIAPDKTADLLLPPQQPIVNDPVHCPCQDTATPTYLPDPRHCDRYYLCYRGRPIQMACCNGHSWNQLQSQCVPAYRTRCGSAASPTPHHETPACPSSGRYFYPHPTACEYFYYCENGSRSLQQCDAFFHWDCRQQRCVMRSLAQCITAVPMSGRQQYYH